MRVTLKQRLRVMIICFCIVSMLVLAPEVHAAEINSLESQSSNLENTLDSIDEELLEIGTKIAENENALDAINGDIVKTEEQLAIARKDEDTYYDEMKLRIRYIYENSGESMLGIILSAESFADFVNKVEFVQSISEYDRNMFEQLQELRYAIESEETHLKEQQEACLKLEEELKANRESLNARAASVSADLAVLETKIQQLKAEQLAKELAAAQKAANSTNSPAKGSGDSGADTNGKNDNNSNTNTANNINTDTNTSNNTNGTVNNSYTPPTGNGVLTKEKGVNYFNGHRETYYSQRVLPGYGLNIPGRHVASDGTIRDENGYLCLASSDYPKGTMVQTSLGMGIVYDTGCDSGTIDIYTDW